MPTPTSPLAGGSPIAAKRNQLVTIQGIPGYWATKTGAVTTAATTDVWDGGAVAAEKLAGRPTHDNLVLSRPYRPARDANLVKVFRVGVGGWRAHITVQDTDDDLVPQGAPTVYANALCVKLTEPDLDSSSADAQTIELEFAIEKVS